MFVADEGAFTRQASSFTFLAKLVEAWECGQIVGGVFSNQVLGALCENHQLLQGTIELVVDVGFLALSGRVEPFLEHFLHLCSNPCRPGSGISTKPVGSCLGGNVGVHASVSMA